MYIHRCAPSTKPNLWSSTADHSFPNICSFVSVERYFARKYLACCASAGWEGTTETWPHISIVTLKKIFRVNVTACYCLDIKMIATLILEISQG